MTMLILRSVSIVNHAPPIDAVKLPDGNLGATMKSLCTLLDVAVVGQVARIKRDPNLATALVQFSIGTPAGPRLMDVLLSWAIPPWLSGLQVTRLSPEKQERAAIIRQGAIEAIAHAFSDQGTTPPPPIDLTPGLDAWQQLQAGFAAVISGFGQLQTAFSSTAHNNTTLLTRVDTLETAFSSMQQRNTALEARVDALERPVHTSDTAGLPEEHIGHMYTHARAIRAKTGTPIADILAGIARHFCVADASDIPPAAWDDVLAWFEGLLRA